jgi:hypothetical protein
MIAAPLPDPSLVNTSLTELEGNNSLIVLLIRVGKDG